MKKLLLTLLLVCSSAFAVDTTTYYNISDDGYAVVPLPFAFPMGGQSFTTSFFFSNGVVGFLQPQTTFCCDGYDLSQQSSGNMSFAIYALQTDLIAANPVAAFYTTTDSTSYLSYHWQNINEYGTGNLNTFSTTIRPTGAIALDYQNVNVQYHNVTVGVTGDILAGQYSQYYSGPGSQFSIPASPLNFEGATFINYCATNPLYNTSCPGYAEAYLAQQCSISALYNTACPGYQQAYFNYQCNINALYNEACPGYATAYLNYQCSINPLYSTTCEGYAQAYYNQQCSINPLYDSGCPGYAEAYYNQQCSINPLYDSGCEGYALAYFNQQCSLNGLYDRTCPNYAEAYALANVVVTKPAEPQPVQQVTSTTNTSTVAVIADPVVNNLVTSTTTTTSPAVAAPVVPLVSAPTTTTTSTAVTTAAIETTESKTEEKKDTSSKSENKSESKTETKSSSSTETKPSAREQIAAKRKEAAMQTAVKAGAEAAAKLDSATSMASQVAVQNVVIQAMGYMPGFNAYSYVMPDGNGYKPFSIYKNQKNVDNRLVEGGLTVKSDRLHQQLIELQYKE